MQFFVFVIYNDKVFSVSGTNNVTLTMLYVFIIGVDGNSTGYQQVEDGDQALSVGRSFTNMVRKSLENARILAGGGTVPEHNIIPMDMVTLDKFELLPWLDWQGTTPGPAGVVLQSCFIERIVGYSSNYM